MAQYKLTIILESELTEELHQQGENNLIDTIGNIDTVEGSVILIIEPSLSRPKLKEVARGLSEWATTQVTNEEVINFVNDVILGIRRYHKKITYRCADPW